ncbi:MAG TPA: hypothetical protein VMH05_25770, partial [Bryobacteraceae bacterium]|nr:hypothetical protein [Bryobacteraceae bacterium]
MKTQVLEAIGQTDLRHLTQIEEGLAANDRIKCCLTLLQTAIAHADHPEQPTNWLPSTGLTTALDRRALDDFISKSHRENGSYRLSGCESIFNQIAQDLRSMAAPAPPEFAERVERILSTLPKSQNDLIDRSVIDDLTRAGTDTADSLHRLVMDLHKALNALQAELAEERLDGATVYQIQDSDRPLIQAFMAGLNRTAPLKFNHPGLGTLAWRSGNKLIVQNDLGTTDAHVIVIHIEGLIVHVIHTDIHPERIQFLRDMLSGYAMTWTAGQSSRTESPSPGVPFQLVTGTFEANDPAELTAYLNFLASRLVFLIDWNRARKELRSFLPGKQRIAVLKWAAESEIGHRAFLELGGAQLINRAIESTAGSAMHFGDRLCDVLGHEPAMDFVRFVFRAAMEGLREHHSSGLIQDRVRAELQVHFSSEGKRLLELASEQAAIIVEIASLVREGIRSIESGDRDGHYQRLAQRAREFEHSADQLVVASREAVRRRPEYEMLFRLLETADNAADELEEVAFLMELLVKSQPSGEALETLGTLADLLVEAAQEWVKALSRGSHVDKSSGMGAQDDVRDFLTAIDALFAL